MFLFTAATGRYRLERFGFIFIFEFQDGGKQFATSLVYSLVKSDIAVAIIGYDLGPKNTIPGMVEQITEAIKVILSCKKNLIDLLLQFIAGNYPHAKLILGGHSAGAHLVAKAVELNATKNPSRIVGLVLFSGVFNLEELPRTYIGRDIG